MATLHTEWADAVIKSDRKKAIGVMNRAGLVDGGVTDMFMQDLAHARSMRRHMGEKAFDNVCRFDSADPVVSSVGYGVAENYFILAKNVTILPFVGTPLLDNLPVVGPEEYPPMADRYIAQNAQNGIGEDGEMTGNDVDFPLFETTTTAMEFKTQLRGGKVVWNWAQQQRQALPGAVNLDKAAVDMAGLQKRLGELRPERSAHDGNIKRGVYGLVNHPGIEVVAPDALTYGSTNIQDWGVTEAAIRDQANTIVNFLQDSANRALGIDGYMPDTLIVPNWLDTRSGRIVYGLAAGGATYPIAPMKQYIMSQCPWIKNWVADPWLNAVNNTTRELAISSNGVPDATVRSSRIFSVRNDRNVLHFAQPIAYQQLPPWMSGAGRFETVAYHQDGGMVVKLPAACTSLIC